MSEDPQPPPPKPKSGFASFWAELKRRKVMRVAITYAVVAWLIIQVAVSTFEGFGIPVWAFRFVVIMLLCFFPVAIILAWAFELTPDGIKTTKKADVERGDAPVSEKQQRKRNWFSLLFAAAVPTLIFGALAVFFYVRSGGIDETIGEKSIAVLPLENMSPDPENAFFADGVQEDIIGNLSKIDELLVIGRTSTLSYKDTTKKLKDIGVELGVRYLLEGSVRRADNEVRVRVTLIDSNTESQLWAEEYQRTLTDTFAIQAEIAQGIATRLEAVISPEMITQMERRPTKSQAAYDLYVQFRQLLERPGGYHIEKVELLEEILAHDPQFAEAWARLSISSLNLWGSSNRQDTYHYERAHHALEMAEKLKPQMHQLPFAKAFVSYFEYQDLEATIELYLEALAIEPSFPYTHRMLGLRYLELGRIAEATHFTENLIRFDPLSLRSNRQLLSIYKLTKEWEIAHNLIQTNMGRGKENEYWQTQLAQLNYLQSGEKQGFVKELEGISMIQNDYETTAEINLLKGEYSKALLLIDKWEPQYRVNYFGGRNGLSITSANLVKALIHFQLGNDQSLDLHEAAIKEFEITTTANSKASPLVWAQLAICYSLEGKLENFKTAIYKVRQKTATIYWKYDLQQHCEIHIAIAYLVLGDHDKAIETLEAASEMDGPIFLNRELDLWFIFDRLRGNPRFDALLED